MQMEKNSITCFQLSGKACNVNARMPVRLRGFLRYNDVVRPLHRIVEVKGSIPYKPDFFFSGFLFTSAEVASITAMICFHMRHLFATCTHLPLPSNREDHCMVGKKENLCRRGVCDKIYQKRFYCELSLMLGGQINPTKIPQFEHAACISENFLHGCYENSDLRHRKIQTPWVSRKQRPP